MSEKVYEIDLYLEKPDCVGEDSGDVVGFDCGYKRILVDSKRNEHDLGLEKIYEKISRKRQGGKAFKRAIVERDNLINQTINQMEFADVSEVVVERLKSVKKNSRGKIRKEFNNKLQRWSYPKVLGKLLRVCEELGIKFTEVNPAYTSQTCSKCGSTHKESRNGVNFRCVECGYAIDADYNAAINISRMGVYSPHAIKYH